MKTDYVIGENGKVVCPGVVCKCPQSCPMHGTRVRREFTDMSDAFDYIRERGYPDIVSINGETWKLFPSGRAEKK